MLDIELHQILCEVQSKIYGCDFEHREKLKYHDIFSK